MILSYQDIHSDVKVDCDVAVIGSGAGGAVMAKELAEMGHSVAVVEEGGYFIRKDFQCRPVKSMLLMYRDGGQTFTMGRPICILPLGKTVGGTTTINSGTCLRIPPKVLKDWQENYGLKELNEEELGLFYERIEKFLYVQPADPEVVGTNNLKFKEGADKLGYSAGFLRRNAKECEGSGLCAFGCPIDAKQSMNISYIPEASKLGATIYANCLVEKVVVENGTATGVLGHFIDLDSRRKTKSIQVGAKVIVLAAGATYSPYFLLKNKLANSSGQVGKHLRIHPCVCTGALFDQDTRCWDGIPQSVYVDEFFEEEGIMLEGVATPPDVQSNTLPYAGNEHARLMGQFSKIALFGSMVSDTTEGSVRTLPFYHKPIMLYDLNKDDTHRLQLSVVHLAEIWLAAGAKRVYPMLARRPELTSPKQVNELKGLKLKGDDFFITAYHPMGTCRMGDDPTKSVVNVNCETWDVKRLFICDASVFPTSPGVNPQMTVMAIATRTAAYIDGVLARTNSTREVIINDTV
jgi:choline dehydrogenase-like flavoprotein